jgi:membrane protein DedA with SNARE-associated domain
MFLVTWAANCAGAAAVYFATFRYGRSFMDTGFGRRLVTPAGIVVIEREYARFGVAGILFARFLPGVRAIVPAFAGLVRLDPARALIPICLASGIWYGAIILLASRVAAEWDTIVRWLSGVNRAMAVVTVVALVVVIVAVVRRRRERRRYLWRQLEVAMEKEAHGPHVKRDPALRAAAALVLELVYADEVLGSDERQLVEAHLTDRWDLERPRGASPADLHAQADKLTARFSHQQRLDLLRRMWRTALRDGPPGTHQERLLGRAAALLGIPPEEATRVAHDSRPGTPRLAPQNGTSS